MHLAHFDIDAFLADYWQQKPLLIRNPWADWHNPLDPDDLAGLACDDDIESRLITRARHDLRLEEGPIPEHRFSALGAAPWTLLVQAVDQVVPAVAALIAPFRFIPNWRIDDVMVSYATDGGGVGAHYDRYDVFLVQGLGHRRWQVGAHGAGACTPDTPLLPHDDLRLLANFEPVAEWLLGPGDILYVPPYVAHNGVAVGDACMTYSIGFRAPAQAELVGDYGAYLAATISEDARYTDAQRTRQTNPGEISAPDLDRLHTMVTAALQDRTAFARWFGQYSTTPKYPDRDYAPDDRYRAADVRRLIVGGGRLSRNPASRFAFVRHEEARLTLFVDGTDIACEGRVAEAAAAICATGDVLLSGALAGDSAVINLVTALLNRGSLFLVAEE